MPIKKGTKLNIDKITLRMRTIKSMVSQSTMRQKKYRMLINVDMIRTKKLLEELGRLTASQRLGDYWEKTMNYEPISYKKTESLSHDVE